MTVVLLIPGYRTLVSPIGFFENHVSLSDHLLVSFLARNGALSAVSFDFDHPLWLAVVGVDVVGVPFSCRLLEVGGDVPVVVIYHTVDPCSIVRLLTDADTYESVYLGEVGTRSLREIDFNLIERLRDCPAEIDGHLEAWEKMKKMRKRNSIEVS